MDTKELSLQAVTMMILVTWLIYSTHIYRAPTTSNAFCNFIMRQTAGCAPHPSNSLLPRSRDGEKGFTSNLGVDLLRLPDEFDVWDKEEEGNKRHLVSGRFYW